MKRILFFLCVIALASCEEKTVEKVVKVFPNDQPEVVEIYDASGTTLIGKKTFFDNGQLHIQGSYLNGKKHGEWLSCYVNGNVWTINTYDQGEYNGPYKMHNDDGSIRIQGAYKQGKESGRWTFFDEHGDIVKELDYE